MLRFSDREVGGRALVGSYACPPKQCSARLPKKAIFAFRSPLLAQRTLRVRLASVLALHANLILFRKSLRLLLVFYAHTLPVFCGDGYDDDNVGWAEDGVGAIID